MPVRHSSMRLFLSCVVALSCFCSLSAKAADADNGERSLPEYLDRWAHDQRFNGVLAVQYRNKPLLQMAYGIADPETNAPVKNSTVFQTGSIDKWFASIAVFKLIEDELVKLDEPIKTYLTGLPTSIGQQLTLHDLMTNRSGLSDGLLREAMGQYMSRLNEPDSDDTPTSLTLAAGISTLLDPQLKFSPGSQFDYVNANWVLVHHILEQVTGKHYGQVLNEYVFGPTGMANSGVFVGDLRNADPERADIAIGFRSASEGYPGDYPLPAFIGGGSYTQAADIVALQFALDEGEVLTPMTIETFRTVTTTDKDYAYGGYIVAKSGNRYSWQSGSNGATNLVSVHLIDGNYSFFAASNTGHSQDAMFDLAGDIEARLADGRLSH